ncbi:MAG: hypothetical protein MZV64_13960 [Ignavibacteriales bacterium]|nr:hypothetical protein [Ignavibacteriales bacterium]
MWPIVSVPWPMTMPSAPVCDLLADGAGQGHVLLRRHVLGEDAEELLRRQVRRCRPAPARRRRARPA